MSLFILQQVLAPYRTLSIVNWLSDEQVRAEQVNLYRRYVNGTPDNFLTDGQVKTLNLRTANGVRSFTDNYCPAILDTMLDRVQLTGIEADNKAAQTWIDDLLQQNRIDQLQVDVHEAALRDGNGFLMVDAIPQADGSRLIRLTQEPAYDSFYGMIVLYETAASKVPTLAAKAWRITSFDTSDTIRMNVYYANRIERYIGFVGGGVRPYGNDVDIVALNDAYIQDQAEKQSAEVNAPPQNPLNNPNATPLALDPEAPPGLPPGPDDDYPTIIPWTMDGGGTVVHNVDGTVSIEGGGEPIGVPIIHFRNKGNNIQTHGISDLVDVIPLQDLLNRTLYDMAATSRLAAFGVRVMVGAEAPDAIQPGTIISKFAVDSTGKAAVPNANDVEWLKSIRLEEFKQAELVPYISQADWLKNEMFAVTNTPEQENASANASGESLRQREVKLIGKVNRFETRNGNAWEDAMLMAARVQNAFSSAKAPVLETLNAKWADPEIRNDTVTQTNALELFQNGLVDQRKALEMIADIYDWDEDDIDAIIAATDKAAANQQNQLTAGDGSAAMDALQRLGLSGQNGATDPSQQGKAMPIPIKPPAAVTPKGVSTTGAQDTEGA